MNTIDQKKPTQMRHQITCKYYQPRSVYINEDTNVWYTVEFKSETFIDALDYLKYIADTCKGVITDVFIQKIYNP